VIGDQDFLRQLLGTFKVEMDERVESLNRALLELEAGRGNPADLVDQLFREAHSLKGAARAVEIKEIEEVAHSMEALLSDVKGGRKLTKPMVSALFQSVDFFEKALNARLAGVPLAGDDVKEWVDRIERARSGTVQAPARKKASAVVAKPAKAGGESPSPPEAAAPEPALPSVGKVIAAAPPPARVKVAPHPSPEPAGAAAPTPEDPSEDTRLPSDRRAGPEDRRRRDRRLDDALLSKETIRVNTAKLDSLLAQAGELLVTKIKIAQLHGEITTAVAGMQQLEKLMVEARRKALRTPVAVGVPKTHDTSYERVRQLNRGLRRILKEFSADTARLHALTRELQEEIKRIRMLPVGLVFDIFYRMVRDLCEAKKKQAVMTTEGGECELDKKLIEALKDPMMHLIRNAVDHGIESPEFRMRRGKPPQGSIHLSARQKGDTIIISVEDDGAGIDIEAVRQKAIRRGLITEEDGANLSERAIINHIFRPGFSTSPIIDDISGRGIGLDVVRASVEKLNGTLDVATFPAAGARFVMHLPLTVSTFQGLLVKVGGQIFILPISSVEQIRRISLEEIRRLGTSETIQINGLPVQVARLAHILGLEAAERRRGERLNAVVLGSAEKQMAYLVDELLGEQEFILKTLSPPLTRVRYVAGATILGNGEIVMILNVPELVNASLDAGVARPAPVKKAAGKRTKTILVVDDSITTRMLEKNILETAGYHVLLAIDGVDALSVLQSESCDLVLTDIQMPRLDGFELTEKLKATPQHKGLPVILVTGLASPEAKTRGIEVGADAYIVKSSFDQAKLLQTIEQLTG